MKILSLIFLAYTSFHAFANDQLSPGEILKDHIAIFENGAYAYVEKTQEGATLKYYDHHAQLAWQQPLGWTPSYRIRTNLTGTVIVLTHGRGDDYQHAIFDQDGRRFEIKGDILRFSVPKTGDIVMVYKRTNGHEHFQVYENSGELVHEWKTSNHIDAESRIMQLSLDTKMAMISTSIMTSKSKKFQIVNLEKGSKKFGQSRDVMAPVIINAIPVGENQAAYADDNGLHFLENNQLVWEKAIKAYDINLLTDGKHVMTTHYEGEIHIFNNEGQLIQEFDKKKNKDEFIRKFGLKKVYDVLKQQGQHIKSLDYLTHTSSWQNLPGYFEFYFQTTRLFARLNVEGNQLQVRYLWLNEGDVAHSLTGNWKLVQKGNQIYREKVQWTTSEDFGDQFKETL